MKIIEGTCTHGEDKLKIMDKFIKKVQAKKKSAFRKTLLSVALLFIILFFDVFTNLSILLEVVTSIAQFVVFFIFWHYQSALERHTGVLIGYDIAISHGVFEGVKLEIKNVLKELLGKTESKKDFWDNPEFQRVRIDKKLTQKQVAQKAGVSVSSVRALEKEWKNVSLELLEKVSKVLDIPFTATNVNRGSAIKKGGKVVAKKG